MAIFSKNLFAVYANQTLIRFGFGIIAVFLPIFFYLQFGKSLIILVGIYISAYILHMLLTPLSAKLIQRIGMKKMMIIGVIPFLLIAVTALALWDYGPVVAVVTYAVAWSVYRALYWVPYHVEVTSFLDDVHRGRQVSLFTNISALTAVIAPIIGGFLIAQMGFLYAFLAALVIFILSSLPLLYLTETKERFDFSYIDTFKLLFSKKNRKLLYAYAGDGGQTVVGLIFWPVFIYLLLDGDFTKVGILSAGVVLATILLGFVTGELVDRASKKQVLFISSIVYTTGWLLKVFTQSALQILVFDTYHKVGFAVNRISFNAGTYEQSADNGHFVDEFTVLKELALDVGRIAMLIIAGVLTIFFGIKVAFVLAALASLLMLGLGKEIRVQT